MENNDWHPADIIAGLRKKGTSLCRSFTQRRPVEFHTGKRAAPPVAEKAKSLLPMR